MLNDMKCIMKNCLNCNRWKPVSKWNYFVIVIREMVHLPWLKSLVTTRTVTIGTNYIYPRWIA